MSLCHFCSPEAFAGVSGLLHRGIWLRRFLATSPTDCHGTRWGPAVLANTGGRRGQEGRLRVTGRACLLPCPAQHHGWSRSRPTWRSLRGLVHGSPAKPGRGRAASLLAVAACPGMHRRGALARRSSSSCSCVSSPALPQTLQI